MFVIFLTLCSAITIQIQVGLRSSGHFAQKKQSVFLHSAEKNIYFFVNFITGFLNKGMRSETIPGASWNIPLPAWSCRPPGSPHHHRESGHSAAKIPGHPPDYPGSDICWNGMGHRYGHRDMAGNTAPVLTLSHLRMVHTPRIIPVQNQSPNCRPEYLSHKNLPFFFLN